MRTIIENMSEKCFSVPDAWYNGCFKDKTQCCSSARSFSMIHSQKPDECWLMIHGFTGYPGELVRPAEDLFEKGYDVFVPRLPGHGTGGKDFRKSRAKDWVGVARNALNDLKTRYKKVNLLGHSMGCCIASVIGVNDSDIGKIVYVAPAFENALMTTTTYIFLRLITLFIPKIPCKWEPDPGYRLEYENAPCDDAYLGREYWRFRHTRQVAEFYYLEKQCQKILKGSSRDCLLIYPLEDNNFSELSVNFVRKNVKSGCRIVEIENGTHFIIYDKNLQARDNAISAILEYAEK